MKTQYSGLIFLLALCLGCVTFTDITDNSILRGQYSKGDILIAQKDMLIADGGWLNGDNSTLLRFNDSLPGNGYKGILKRGEKVQIIQIVIRHHPINGDTINPIALVLDGQFKGQRG